MTACTCTIRPDCDVHGSADERIAERVEAGWTQRQIAEEIGISGPAVNKRLQRLGLRTVDPRGGDRSFANSVSKIAERLDPSIEQALAPRPTTTADVHPITIAGIRFPQGGISDTRDPTQYNTANLKTVADDLIRRATPEEATALVQLFTKYAERAERKA